MSVSEGGVSGVGAYDKSTISLSLTFKFKLKKIKNKKSGVRTNFMFYVSYLILSAWQHRANPVPT